MTDITIVTAMLEAEFGNDFPDFLMMYSVGTVTAKDGTKYDLMCDGISLVLDAKEGGQEVRVKLEPLVRQMLATISPASAE